MAKIKGLPYIAWRDDRPRFVPGTRERAAGFKGIDLKHDDGRWFTVDEARVFARTKLQEISAARSSGRRYRAPASPRGRALEDLWEAYRRSEKFATLASSSQSSYARFMRPVQDEPVWRAPVAALDPVVLKAMHERIMAARGPAMANAAISVVSAALGWGRLHNWLPRVHGRVVENPASRLDLPSLGVRLRVGTDTELGTLVVAADHLIIRGVPAVAIGDAVLTGFFSGQRKRDVLLFIGEVGNDRINLVQSKTGARVSIPYAPRLAERMAQSRVRRAALGLKVEAANIVINEATGRPFTGGMFRDHFNQVRALAVAGMPGVFAPCPSLADFTFPDLRDTAVTWYARAGCTVPEIASITGHTPGSIYTILKHYLALDEHLADAAVAKLVAYMAREGFAV